MIEVYLYKPNGEVLIEWNDSFFNVSSYEAVSQSTGEERSKLANIIRNIDGSELLDGSDIRTGFGHLTDISNLSTGCKTAINVYLNPDKLISCDEAGNNAFEEILNIGTGRIQIRELPVLWDDVEVDILLHSHIVGDKSYSSYYSLCEEAG
ncbi:MAG: hypothetical protein Q4F28_15145 [Eubacteriales bacterium]|nr:hypothetical protein [Eubacteriales bacterium]